MKVVEALSQMVRVELDDGVATIVVDRPPLNALNNALRIELGSAIGSLVDDDGVRAVVVTGGPKAFAAGADLKELVSMGYEQISGWNRALQRVFTEVAALPVPVIAAVNGFALGGGMELALAADFRILGQGAIMALPEIQLGIVPGAGGIQRLRRLVGISTAKQLLMSGRRIAADEALSIGLAEYVVPDGEVLERAQQLAAELAAGPRFALQAIKESVDLGADSSLAASLAFDRSNLAGLFATDDRERGMESFFAEGLGKARFGGHEDPGSDAIP